MCSKNNENAILIRKEEGINYWALNLWLFSYELRELTQDTPYSDSNNVQENTGSCSHSYYVLLLHTNLMF